MLVACSKARGAHPGGCRSPAALRPLPVLQLTSEVKESKRRLDKRSSEYDAARLRHLGHRWGEIGGWVLATASPTSGGRTHGK